MSTTATGPWSVKGVDPKAREIAKDLARRSGMTLGEWLNQVIAEGGEPEAPPFQAPYREPFADPASRRPTASAYAPEGYGEAPAPRTGDIARIAEALQSLSARMEAAEHRSTLAISGVDQSVMGVLSRLEGLERDQVAVASRFEGALDDARTGQARAAERVRRLEQEEGSRTEALKALEAALSRVAADRHAGEAGQAAAIEVVRGQVDALSQKLEAGSAATDARVDARVSAKLDTALGAALEPLREEIGGVSRRMNRLESAAAAAPDTYADAAMVESALTRMAARLDQAESKTSEAVSRLGASFAGLDARVNAHDERLGAVDPEAADRRFAALATELAAKVDASRQEMAEQLRAAATGRVESMEAALRTVSGQVEQSERRSALAIDRIGKEVTRVAQALAGRVSAAETRSAAAVEQAGAQMARIAETMEGRLKSADEVQAHALEKLGGEIARIAEKLAERVAASERRSASAIDDIGDQVARAAERIDQRHERAADELAERMRQSEERTARLLEEARDRLDQKLTQAQRRVALEQMAAQGPTPTPEPMVEAPAPAPPPVIALPEPPLDPFGPMEPIAAALEPEPAASHAAFDPPTPELTPEATVTSPFDDSFFADPPPSPPAVEAAAPGYEIAPDPALFDAPPPPELAQAARAGSHREMLDAARAAARQASIKGAAPVGSVTAPDYEPEEKRASGGGGLFSLTLPKRRKQGGVTLRTIAVASGTAAAISVTAVGASMVYGLHPADGGDRRSAGESDKLTASLAPTAAKPASDPALAGGPAPVDVTAPAPNPGAQSPELAAVALAPALTGAAPAARPAPAHAQAKPAPAPLAAEPAPIATTSAAPLIYSAAVRRIESGDAGGLADLRRAANLGHAPAEFYLGKLYENGGAGLRKDMAEARRWTERAAVAGDIKAMHNLGLYYFEGDGGEKNVTTAAGWFRRAAENGLEDSQYNLARLYEKGYGVSQNPAEAYKWYLVAASQGDGDARTAAQGLRKTLPPEAASAAERSAAALRSQFARATVAPAPTTPQPVTPQ